jgi:hypothetical protein
MPEGIKQIPDDERMSLRDAADEAQIVKDVHDYEVANARISGQNLTDSERYDRASKLHELRGGRDNRTQQERGKANTIASLQIENERLKARIRELEGEGKAT